MRARPDATGDLSIEVPTRILVGSNDRVTPIADAESMARAIGHSTHHVLEGAGHFSNIERPEAFARAAFSGWQLLEIHVPRGKSNSISITHPACRTREITDY